jgi:hypothetical protein
MPARAAKPRRTLSTILMFENTLSALPVIV